MSNNLDRVVQKIDHSNSTLNLYTNFSQNDRITLNSTPCYKNSTGSCKGLVSEFTPMQFQAFDFGRYTYQSQAQEDDCIRDCLSTCNPSFLDNPGSFNDQSCLSWCYQTCIENTTKDFV